MFFVKANVLFFQMFRPKPFEKIMMSLSIQFQKRYNSSLHDRSTDVEKNTFAIGQPNKSVFEKFIFAIGQPNKSVFKSVQSKQPYNNT